MNTKCPAIISDVPDANELAIDDEGMELPTLGCPAGAAKSLVNTAKHAVWTKAETIAGPPDVNRRAGWKRRCCNIRRLNDQDNKL